MATTLVVKNANFSENALDTVSFEELIPCTDITLNKSTSSINYLGTDTISATLSPSDTTDVLGWESSNTSVATVLNGVVTAVGVGTATITATCGECSAQCNITVIATASFSSEVGQRYAGGGIATGGNGSVYPNAGTKYGILFSSTGNKPMYYDYPGYYPIVIPQNATKVRINKGTSAKTIYRVPLIDTTKAPSGVSDSCLLYDFYSESNMTEVESGIYEFTIPTYEGYIINAIAVSFSTANTFTDSDFNGVGIEFLA